MIPYEELCSALAKWREKNGLTNGPSSRMPKGAVIVPLPHTSPGESPPAVDSGELNFTASTSSGYSDTMTTNPGEVRADEGGTAITPSPYDPEAEVLYDEEGEAPTSLHFNPDAAVGAAIPRETTNELELDDLVDDDDPAKRK